MVSSPKINLDSQYHALSICSVPSLKTNPCTYVSSQSIVLQVWWCNSVSRSHRKGVVAMKQDIIKLPCFAFTLAIRDKASYQLMYL
mmetsp:Transcript_20602/g.42968  ORF Transcript_20602/g.42968 Transcript_20602/m.42968 type:complete len:86 (+) Transcript_20602:199-456(+)